MLGEREVSKRKSLQCPFGCEKEYKTLKKGSITRCCDREVVRVNGSIYADLDDAPEWQVLMEFVEQKRSHGMPFYEVPYGSSSYKDNLRAIQTLLKRVDGDVSMAKRITQIAFEASHESWHRWATPFAVIQNSRWPNFFAVAQQERRRSRARERQQKQRADALALGTEWEQAYEQSFS